MEDQPRFTHIDQEESKEPDNDNGPKKSNKIDFVGKWLAITGQGKSEKDRFDAKSELDEEDEDSEENTSPLKKYRSFLKKLFSSAVTFEGSKEKQPNKTNEKTDEYDPNTSTHLKGKDAGDQEVVEKRNIVNGDSGEISLPLSKSEDFVAEDGELVIDHNQPTQKEVVGYISESEDTIEPNVEIQKKAQQENKDVLQNEQPPTHQEDDILSLKDNTNTAEKTQSEPESVGTIIERLKGNSGVGAFLGAEILHKRRHAKTKNELKKLKKTTKKNKDSIVKLNAFQKTQEAKNLQPNQFFGFKKTEVSNRPIYHNEVVVPQEVHLPTTKIETVPTQSKEERIVSHPQADLYKPKKDIDSQQLLKELRVTEKTNILSEKQLETRHEIMGNKDEPAVIVHSGVLATQSSTGSQTFEDGDSNSIKRLVNERQKNQNNIIEKASQDALIKQAVMSGFWFAIILLIGFFILIANKS